MFKERFSYGAEFAADKFVGGCSVYVTRRALLRFLMMKKPERTASAIRAIAPTMMPTKAPVESVVCDEVFDGLIDADVTVAVAEVVAVEATV